MTDTTQRDATTAERDYAAALETLRVLDFATQETTTALASVLTHDPDLARTSQERLQVLENRRDNILAYLNQGQSAAAEMPPSEAARRLSDLAAALETRAAATDVDGFQRALREARGNLKQLQASKLVADSASALKNEVARLKELNALETAMQQTDTKGITRKATDLTSEYATAQILDNFTRETDRMNLRRVTLKDRGGQKGKVNQIPALLGARHKSAKTPVVLSEGEQTVLGLAGFFTEAVFDDSKSALILDDPVTSLDHVRRDTVALRLAMFATDRQVIVFTHDVAFITDLLAAAGQQGVTVASRSIQHRGDTPGYCLDGLPWKAQDIGQRLNTILNAIQRLARDRNSLNDDQYEARVSEVAGLLSETWERTVTSEIINKVYDRAKSQVHPSMVRMLVKINGDDNKDYQEGYGHTSKWARRHDKAEETNYVPPEPVVLESEYERLKAWHKRIKSYQN